MLNIQHLMWRWKSLLTSRLQHRFTHYPLSIYMRKALSNNMAHNSPRDPLNQDSGENGSYHTMWKCDSFSCFTVPGAVEPGSFVLLTMSMIYY